jgi:RimJ/RimL family protein N-acetyltransferase
MPLTTPPALPCLHPATLLIPGHRVDLERADVARHAAGLWRAIGTDPELWSLIPPGPFADEAAFTEWLTDRAGRTDTALYTIMDKATGKPAGLFFLLGIDTAMGVIEMGLVYGPALSRKTAGTEAFFLLARHVIDTLSYRRLEWRCGPGHTASRHAAERFGFTLEGILRQTMWTKGRNWDTAVYSILDQEWPAIETQLEAWLSPGNFGAAGGQRRSLRIRPSPPSNAG